MLEKLDIYAILPSSEDAVAQYREIGSVLRARKKEPSRVAEGTLLSAKKTAPYYLSFHLDFFKKEKKAFVHFGFYKKPKSQPPALTRQLFDEGKTIEWLTKELSSILKDRDSLSFCETQLSAPEFHPDRLALVAPPVELGSSVLEIAGAEYRTNDKELGVTRIRWSAARNKQPTTVWLSYLSKVQWTHYSPWRDEESRCKSFLASYL